MIKWISSILIILLGIVISIILYLSTVGIETKSFNNLIENKVKNYNQNLLLKFDKVKLLLDPKKLDLKIKLIQPKIVSKNNELLFRKVNSNLSLKSYIKGEFALKNIELKLSKVELKKLTKFIRSIDSSVALLILNNSIKKGNVEAETILFFNKDGKLLDNYEIKGKIINVEVNILDEYQIKNINSNFKIKKDIFEFNIKDARLFDVDLQSTQIILKKKLNDLYVEADINIKGKLDNINDLLINFDLSLEKYNINFSNLDFNLNNKINFKLEKFIKLQDFQIEGEGMINNITFYSDNINEFKKVINVNKNIEFKSNKIFYTYKKSSSVVKTSGNIKLNEKFEDYSSEINYDYKNKSTIFDANINLNNSNIYFENINYFKPINKKANLKMNGYLSKNKKVLQNLEYVESKNRVLIKNLRLDNKIKIYDFDVISVNTLKDNTFRNNFSIHKKKKMINFSGKKYDATYFFKNLNKDSKKKILSEKFNGKINFEINEIVSTNDPLFDFAGVGQIKFGKFHKLTAKASYSDNELLHVSINPIDNNKKKLIVNSDRAKPFINDFKFIKGFEDGKLEYISNYDDANSKSNLKIHDFKLQDVPILAKILSLASLQGFADLLTGEGIRFKELEMDLTTKKNLITIDEMYAIGPSISVLLSGYVVKGELISLRGTLVPATTLNKVIGSIPILGNILVGKKTGEGIFGVSFKIKGPPKDLKTTVNPIKTLTPRFITRTLEKIKKTN